MNHDKGLTRHTRRVCESRCPVSVCVRTRRDRDSGSAPHSQHITAQRREATAFSRISHLGIVTQCSRPCRAAAYDCATCFEAAGCCCCCWRGSPAWYPACRPRGRRARCQGHASRATLSSIPEKRSHPGPPRHRTQGGRRPSAASAAARSRGRRGGPRGSPSAPTAPGPRARPASGS